MVQSSRSARASARGGFGLARPLRHLAAAQRTPAREHLGLANAEPELRRPVGPPGTADVAAHSDRGQLIGVGIELDQDAVGQPDASVADLLGPFEQDLLCLLRGLGAGEVADADLAVVGAVRGEVGDRDPGPGPGREQVAERPAGDHPRRPAGEREPAAADRRPPAGRQLRVIVAGQFVEIVIHSWLVAPVAPDLTSAAGRCPVTRFTGEARRRRSRPGPRHPCVGVLHRALEFIERQGPVAIALLDAPQIGVRRWELAITSRHHVGDRAGRAYSRGRDHRTTDVMRRNALIPVEVGQIAIAELPKRTGDDPTRGRLDVGDAAKHQAPALQACWRDGARLRAAVEQIAVVQVRSICEVQVVTHPWKVALGSPKLTLEDGVGRSRRQALVSCVDYSGQQLSIKSG